ncbi:Hypothetical protein PBC10988_13350 [Planctomycetales bacterium 10988]|nr:Hypothetical protein PBC10988_13350 [Planctomycetales bacterium 10988]
MTMNKQSRSPFFFLQLGLWLLVLVTMGSLYTWRILAQPEPIQFKEDPRYALEFSPTVEPIQNFQLIERSGEAFDSATMDGKLWVVSFFYTSCTGPCATLNRSIEQLQNAFQGEEITFVSISVDPSLDTPERLQTYADHFNADPKRWLFLTGEPDNVQQIGQEIFKVATGAGMAPEQGDHEITHSDRLILIDQEGMVQGYFSALSDSELEMLKRKVRKLSAQPELERVSQKTSQTSTR